ncbi:Ribulose-phosphate 3 epimerase family protein [Candidatus Bilamarchaeum dharawalense]|uniref:Ribulose-phosphate 3 epimerase family protein n=1 Tax=Candidatus Bilamarchaeum dharawalense TaxID=2885759 RepID=A0A5E4LR73_9ARCH|nr:Ribulose-phosphate 3 epimerase family protein [Candidatus Bilamarchaeum dharawalense]
MRAEVVPAILVKTREDLLHRIHQVLGLVKEIQLDIMDGKFVPNQTIGLESLGNLPKATYEFHWMVFEPEKWIEKIQGPNIHLVHVETITSLDTIQNAIKKSGGKLGFAINPETSLDKLLPLIKKAKPIRVLVMTVHPGFSGQKYIYEMKEKIEKLRSLYPKLDIEVDGGINEETGRHAYLSGANILAAASALFSSPNIKDAINNLKRVGEVDEKH